MANSNTIRILLVLAGLLFISGIGYLGVEYFKSKTVEEQKDELIGDLSTEVNQLEASVLELEVLFDDVNVEVAAKDAMLRQSYDQISFLEKEVKEKEQEIIRLKKEGKLSKEQIALLESQLSNAKTKITQAKSEVLDRYAKELRAERQNSRELQAVLDSVQKLAQIQQEQITAIQEGMKNQPAPIVDPLGSVRPLRAENFKFQGLDRNGKTGSDINAKKMKALRVQFEILDEPEARTGLHQLYMVIRDPNGFVLTNRAENYGGTMRVGNQSKDYSQSASIDYRRRRLPIKMDYKPSSSEPFQGGVYEIQIYSDDRIIGQGQFTMN